MRERLTVKHTCSIDKRPTFSFVCSNISSIQGKCLWLKPTLAPTQLLCGIFVILIELGLLYHMTVDALMLQIQRFETPSSNRPCLSPSKTSTTVSADKWRESVVQSLSVHQARSSHLSFNVCELGEHEWPVECQFCQIVVVKTGSHDVDRER